MITWSTGKRIERSVYVYPGDCGNATSSFVVEWVDGKTKPQTMKVDTSVSGMAKNIYLHLCAATPEPPPRKRR